jgi:nicotinamide mononucleotide transporter
VIHELLAQATTAWQGTTGIELAAALLAVAYTVLAIWQRIECWVAAFVSSCLYIWVMFGAHLYMESALNAFYAVVAVYGFWQWRHGLGGGLLEVSRWSLPRHAGAFAVIVALSTVTAYFLRRYTPAASPWVDSMVTWSSVFATFLAARKVYENWHWFLVIDSVCVYLYITRRLFLTTLLFLVYLGLIIIGMRQWRRPATAHAAA